MGLAATQTIGRILIHPTNPDIVYVAAPGHEWTYNPDRGVFKTTDGGKTWQKVLYINEKVGAIDLVMDPTHPDTLDRLDLVTGSAGAGAIPTPARRGRPLQNHRWRQDLEANSTTGLPDTKPDGRIGLDICRTKPNVVYAYVDNHNPDSMPKPGERDSYGRRNLPDDRRSRSLPVRRPGRNLEQGQPPRPH